MSSSAERPERSRNAKAQARHRAKRKAYIEQLEQTVTKLQTAMGVTPEQVAALPPPLAKIRELEQENARLAKENDELRRLLTDSGIPFAGPNSSNGGNYITSQASYNGAGRGMQLNRTLTGGSPVNGNGPGMTFHDTRNVTDSYGGLKRRKMSAELESNFSSENTDLNALRAPPPLTIPHHSSSSQHYPPSHPSSHLPSPHPTSAHVRRVVLHFRRVFHIDWKIGGILTSPVCVTSLFLLSSPPSSTLQPAQMQNSAGSVAHSPVSQLGNLSRPGTSSSVSSIHAYNHGYVKVEEESYQSSHNSHHPSSHSNPTSSGGYTLPPFDAMDPALAGPGTWQHPNHGGGYSTTDRGGPGGLGR
ncbi:hypothetical protein DFJ43DRAFT_1158367 [Lentinula guzmanii]|uniref:BZIP domain-containing protein n=1 Tax=Lentinula guzmanii TaxID=2804957 RepID=A0AA38MWW8_9AGAR|nr:hypothetical protein DFJ43DRAFT_1158367 [Lentinula guzmanii]